MELERIKKAIELSWEDAEVKQLPEQGELF
jgi:hypothetical protein